MKKSTIFLSTLFIFSTLLVVADININYSIDNVSNRKESIDPLTLKSSYFVNISPILIDSNSDWIALETAEDWCSGSGTPNDPYKIEDVIMNNSIGQTNVIEIRNSNAYFILDNITIDGKDDSMNGIVLNNTVNGTIMNSSIKNINGTSIIIEKCSNITTEHSLVYYDDDLYEMNGIEINKSYNISIKYMNITNLNGFGLNLTHSSNISIKHNILSELWFNQHFLTLDNCSNNLIYNNSITNKGRDGIRLIKSHNNTIKNNYIYSVYSQGINFHLDSDHNNISFNHIEYVGEFGGVGGEGMVGGINSIYIYRTSNNNTFHNNILSHSADRGICIENDINNAYNLFYNNTFIGNGIQRGSEESNVIDFGQNNHYNNSIIGNYWDSYIGKDFNSDQIGDDPYNITDTHNTIPPKPILAKDYLPIYNWTTKWKHTTLFINNTDLNNNWLIANNTYEWCNGSGTEIKPFIINNVTFLFKHKDSI